MAPNCLKDDAEPIFTAALHTVTKKRETRQPKWFCERHRKGKHRVSPTTGRRVVKHHNIHRYRKEEVKKVGEEDE